MKEKNKKGEKMKIKTRQNLEGAFAGESMAYQKYKYFAKIARKNGDEEVAKLFEETAKHETNHAEGHLRFLYPMKEMTTRKCLELARDGEKFEYTEMYPSYAKTAEEEGASDLVKKEFLDGITECQDHEKGFVEMLDKINKVFGGLTKVEKEHHDNYQRTLDSLGEKVDSTFEISNDYLERS